MSKYPSKYENGFNGKVQNFELITKIKKKMAFESIMYNSLKSLDLITNEAVNIFF